MISQVARVVGCVLLLALAAGCRPTNQVSGKVIEGNISFIGAVDPRDERFKGPGLEGATVGARALMNDQPTVELGSTTASKTGDFTLKLNDQSSVLKPVQFGAHKEGFQPASGNMSIPSSDRRLLIILRPEQAQSRPK